MAEDGPDTRLLSHQSTEEGPAPLDHADLESDDDSAYVLDEAALRRPGRFIWLLTLSSGLSGLLFGYDTGVTSSTLVSINSDLSSRVLNTLDKSIIASSTALFALLASPVTGILADRLGRKPVILLSDVLFIGGALWQALSGSVWSMTGGRSLVGLAVGSASFVTPLYISELAPSPFRGRLVTVSVLNIALGQVIAYVVGHLFSEIPHGWRWMVGLGGIPALLQLVLLAPLPESPRWLIKHQQDTTKARAVLDKIYGSGHEVQHVIEVVLRGIVLSNQEEEAARRRRDVRSVPSKYSSWKSWHSYFDEGWVELLTIGANRRALAISCLLQGLQQLCGFNSLMYFSATLFKSLGFHSPTLTALSVATTNFLFTLLALLLIDRAGRRKILLYSIPAMIFGLIITSIAFLFLPSHPTKTHSTSPDDVVDGPSQIMLQTRTPALTILASLTLYVASYALGLGNVPWQQSELFPLSVRSLGSSVATATNWASNFVIGLTFLPMMSVISPTATFAIYAVVCVAGWWMIYRIYPETKGLSIEQVNELLREGWGVAESLGRGRGGGR